MLIFLVHCIYISVKQCRKKQMYTERETLYFMFPIIHVAIISMVILKYTKKYNFQIFSWFWFCIYEWSDFGIYYFVQNILSLASVKLLKCWHLAQKSGLIVQIGIYFVKELNLYNLGNIFWALKQVMSNCERW